MRSTRAIGVTAAMLSVLVASGCGGGSGGDDVTSQSTAPKGIASGEPAPPQTTSATGPSSAATPSSSSSSTKPSSKGTAAGAPGVPEPARQHTKAGAKAFAKHYMNVINSAGQNPEVGTLEPLATTSCKSCNNYEETVSYLVKHEQRFNGPQYSFQKASLVGYSEIATFVKVVASEPAVQIVDSDGASVESYKTVAHSASVYELSWKKDAGWRIVSIKEA